MSSLAEIITPDITTKTIPTVTDGPSTNFHTKKSIIEANTRCLNTIFIKAFNFDVIKNKRIQNLIITRGSDGAILMNNKHKVFSCPGFALKSLLDRNEANDSKYDFHITPLDRDEL